MLSNIIHNLLIIFHFKNIDVTIIICNLHYSLNYLKVYQLLPYLINMLRLIKIINLMLLLFLF